MTDEIRSIKKIAIDMISTTSRNDDRREKLQDIIELCDEHIAHFIDDAK